MTFASTSILGRSLHADLDRHISKLLAGTRMMTFRHAARGTTSQDDDYTSVCALRRLYTQGELDQITRLGRKTEISRGITDDLRVRSFAQATEVRAGSQSPLSETGMIYAHYDSVVVELIFKTILRACWRGLDDTTGRWVNQESLQQILRHPIWSSGFDNRGLGLDTAIHGGNSSEDRGDQDPAVLEGASRTSLSLSLSSMFNRRFAVIQSLIPFAFINAANTTISTRNLFHDSRLIRHLYSPAEIQEVNGLVSQYIHDDHFPDVRLSWVLVYWAVVYDDGGAHNGTEVARILAAFEEETLKRMVDIFMKPTERNSTELYNEADPRDEVM